jgi:hypothetical protein
MGTLPRFVPVEHGDFDVMAWMIEQMSTPAESE